MKEKILQIIDGYKKDFKRVNEDERYKWEAVGCYKKNWDIEAENFSEMYAAAYKKSGNLLSANMYWPYKMVIQFAEEEPDKVRELFKMLFNEEIPLAQRYVDFRAAFDEFYKPKEYQHYQDLHAISVYLTFEYPEKYFIYKYKMFKSFSEKIGYEVDRQKFKSEVYKLEAFLEMCNLVLDEVKQDNEVKEMSAGRLTDDCYKDDNLHLLTHDVIYFGANFFGKAQAIAEDSYWPSLEEYNPNLSKDDWKRFILEVEKPNHPSPMRMLKAMMDLGGEASCKRLASLYGGSTSSYVGCTVNLGKRVQKYFALPAYHSKGEDKETVYVIPFQGRNVVENGTTLFSYKIRPELFEALKEIDLSDVSPMYEDDEESLEHKQITDVNKNTILYGPPGTGKTYNTIVYAVAIIEDKLLQEVKEEPYDDVLERYNQYKSDGLVEFTTFHQSYGYEEFIEGIKPVMENTDEDQTDIQYQISSGLFKSFCEKASRPIIKQAKKDIGLNASPSVWKVSLEGTGENPTRTDCLTNGHIRVGYDSYGKDITSETNFDNGGKNVINAFIYKMQIGDIVLSCYSSTTIDAIGVVTGEYEWHEEYSHYKRLRKVNWLVKGIRQDITEINNGSTLTLSSVYKLNISLADVMNIITEKAPAVTEVEEKKKNYVFVIDEINRGNISKIFGELITLIETSKHLGQSEGMRVKLPYSQKLFGVPDNVFIIGTMNTADRSIATIDTALRRRFRFKEMLPDSTVLEGVNVEDVSVADMLTRMNKRITVLYDREHTIGHAYFVPLIDNPTIEQLAEIFENSIIPLLQEYFYEDYEKIRLVLGDNNKTTKEEQFITVAENDYNELFGSTDVSFDDSVIYEINKTAFDNIEAYRSI